MEKPQEQRLAFADAAGILFVNKWPRPTHCLGGFHPKRGGITGFGGKAEPGDYGTYHTACREVLEELLGITNPMLAAYMMREFEPVRQFEAGGYTTFVLTFEQLERVLAGLKRLQESTAFYDEFPVKVWDCVLGRRVDSTMEVGELALLPICMGTGVLEELLEDMQKI
jgi:hypothetical protein